MTLKDFAIKYNMNPEELLELLIFEGFPINTIDSEIDDRLLQYLLEYSNKNNKKNIHKKGFKHNTKKIQDQEVLKKNRNVLYNRSMTIAECTQTTEYSASYFINFFLKRKKLYSINSFLSVGDIAEFAKEHNVSVLENDALKKNNTSTILEKKIKSEGSYFRNPVVVVVGHVDHGKTTLLDTIRKKNVATSEKGGITQHIGAYEIAVNNKSITFLDTPGHEAFTELRGRGVTIADIAILVIAADDGMKPQTIESIKMLQEMGVQVIVAITKIDKATQKNYDHIYTELTQYNIVPEAWGGNVPVVFVSAVKNQGINELLDTILLIADLADLKTTLEDNAFGYVLESKMEKGRGAVATVILQSGLLSISDAYYANTVWGKVVSAFDCNHKAVKKLYPGKPYVISGFMDIPLVGSNIIQADLKTARARAQENKENIAIKNYKTISNVDSSKNYNIIIKADAFSSLQAIDKAIENYQMSDKFFYKPYIIHKGIGELNANDINMAISAEAKIYTFSIKKISDKDILDVIKDNNVVVEYYDVIYALLENIEKNIEKEKTNAIELKKIGELHVLKLFAVKHVGQIIGFKVLSGIVKPGSIGKVIRNNVLIGKSTIKSLEKERVSVKELSKGYEGALSFNSNIIINEAGIIEIYSE